MRACAEVVADLNKGTAEQIPGGINGQKLHSSTTLFLQGDPEEAVFQPVLDRYFAGQADRATDERL